MNRELLTFPKGGIHPPEHKEISEHLQIERMPIPAEVDILLQQHFGAPCSPLVKKKDIVNEGDVIGTVSAGLGASVHASVTGTVKNIGTSPHPTSVKAPSITILTDTQAQPRTYGPADWKAMPRDEMLSRIKEAGIVGIGGAGFPTHVKLAPPPAAKVDTLLLNGAECEPYLTTDHRLMLESPGDVVGGASIILRILGINECKIGIEANKPAAIDAMEKAVKEASSNGQRISVVPLKVKYPQGSEKQLIQSLTGRKVPGFGLPFDVSVIVQNVGTAKAVYDAVCLAKPLYEKVVTISGKGISRPANLLVRIGTRLKDIVEYLGGTKNGLAKVVMGGPMMGFAIPTLDVPVMKTTSGVLFLTEDEIDLSPHGHCIRCGWCLDACPMGLSPNEIGVYVEAGRAEDTSQFGLFECFECGCCAFVCPARRPLVQFIRLAKMKAKK
ncbi:MAG: electron transport complex subunit RsxC [Deltaproteobacteria bacterium CG23_combo_of_CG06-09_8_20_14_all_51_20]|nr:electron transport complex subunit RsxC [bacterium]OIP39163.1 MAG: electron transport complex subunit RsxC [Desulfobacteraceae bacterium CG2_30_51_40]PIP45561.1 MAG: electron transport complex subunit RsxC [Deltaproteobacteria bacterium CG23_combo_of_CG06-09_8_20_14_all_51_20]PIY24030.1 MAG: electron transport complex subunit RsxC [Deltaproteobacteria bacterium CG_4_10_14_3_um_filter_51_14]PJB35887.1 MAG: electron transport complex subunit RsxC [Deltaproteobacteria bacterium CG_4_9_14_3_um_f